MTITKELSAEVERLTVENASITNDALRFVEERDQLRAEVERLISDVQGYVSACANLETENAELRDKLEARQKAQPMAYVVFASNGNIRIWGHAPDDVKRIKAEFGSSLIPLYANPQVGKPEPSISEKYEVSAQKENETARTVCTYPDCKCTPKTRC